MSETKKNRPTPKRNQAVSKRPAFAPIVSKEQKKVAREQARQKRIAAREAMMRGDENALPARDRGPVRRFVRDYVDSRRSIGEYSLPIMLIVLVLVWSSSFNPPKDPKEIPLTTTISVVLMWTMMAYAFIYGAIMSRQIKKAVREKFPDAHTKGLGLYGFTRATQMRRMRTPRPQTEHVKRTKGED